MIVNPLRAPRSRFRPQATTPRSRLRSRAPPRPALSASSTCRSSTPRCCTLSGTGSSVARRNPGGPLEIKQKVVNVWYGQSQRRSVVLGKHAPVSPVRSTPRGRSSEESGGRIPGTPSATADCEKKSVSRMGNRQSAKRGGWEILTW